ncbi:metalloregulator ArsR/SmtB family transcription factor [Gymnodinialimonas ceratoperidinii]|uniref:Metalloregulator ArsR/SmtB family transcription factor n=2 Tax=Gymnodinialimonas ceratoperidinii TaxID=2856823 RepID=A0A8F6U0H3_9RHOB|nr:metalloregulator ArsR/SmtB family transcription factor [Gymnodinialimonas ceratoperidinii]
MQTDPHDTFKALADPTRREILGLLKSREMTIGDVTRHFDITRPAVKKHLAILESGRLITVTPRGRERINAINPEGFRELENWLEIFDRFWDDRLSALKTAVEKDAS